MTPSSLPTTEPQPGRKRFRGRLWTLWPLAVLAFSVLILPSCAWDGHFCVLGYSTKPNYDPNICSVRVPIFRNISYWTVTPTVGLDMDMTRTLVREIEQKTPFKVKQDADTELKGTIVSLTKASLAPNQFNYPRENEITLTVEILWTDLRTGEVLSQRARRPGVPRADDPRAPILAVPDGPNPLARSVTPLSPPSLPSDATAARGLNQPDIDPWDQVQKKKPQPIMFRSVGNFRPELGESTTTALKACVDRMAEQIVSAMEVGW